MTARYHARLRSLHWAGAVRSIFGEFGRDAYLGTAAGTDRRTGLGPKRPARAGIGRPLPA